MKTLFRISLFLLLPYLSFSQDRILLLNGREINAQIIDTNFLEVNFQFKPGKVKDIERYRVFSINWNNAETVLYRQDTSIGNNYNEHQMRMFVNGGNDATRKFKSPLVFWGGVAAGIIGSYVQPTLLYNLGKPNDPASPNKNELLIKPFFSPIIPICYTLAIGGSWIKIKKSDISNPLYLSEDTYLEGYERVARGRRVQKAILGCGTGLITGFIIGALAPQ